MAPTKHRSVYEQLKRDIVAGKFPPGSRLPSEAKIVEAMSVSRITATRALTDLKLDGFAERRAGSGTYVPKHLEDRLRPRTFGMLFPEMETAAIFPQLAKAIVHATNSCEHAIFPEHYGSGTTSAKSVAATKRLIQREVDGVFFAPLEHVARSEVVNNRVLTMLAKAHIPVVLIDKLVGRTALRKKTDVVGLNHRHASMIMTEHLLERPFERIAFITNSSGATSVIERMEGFRDAIRNFHISPRRVNVFEYPREEMKILRWIRAPGQKALLAMNDQLAAEMLREILKLGLAVPTDVRLAGMDDNKFLRFLPVAISSFAEPLEYIGAVAVNLLLDRIRDPHIPPRVILLDGEIIVRESSC